MYEEDINIFLEHHGVKGMHWGIRNEKAPLTKEQIKQKKIRKKKIIGGIKTAAWSVLVGAAFISPFLRFKGSTRISDVRTNRHSAFEKVEKIINQERNTQLSSLKRMHQEGHMSAEQARNFISTLNARYDRRITEAFTNKGGR